jgi:type II secretion system protein N
MSRRLRISGWLAFTGFSLVAGLVLTFPYDALGRRVEAEVAKAMPGTTVVIREIGPALPVGVRLGRVLLRREPPPTTGPAASAIEVEIDRIRLTPAWLGLFTMKPGVNFEVDALLGKLDGSAQLASGGLRLRALARTLSVDEGGLMEKLTNVQLSGAVSGRVNLDLDAKGAVEKGLIEMGILNARLKGGKAGGFTLPPIDLGSPTLIADIEAGEAKQVKLSGKSPDLELEVQSSVSLRPVFSQSLAKGSMRVKFNDSWLNANPSFKGLLGLARQFQKADGALEVPINGPLSRPVPLPGF